jgi:hypothetical protein
MTEYFRREQAGGRVSDRISPEHAAHLVLGACFAKAFMVEIHGDAMARETDERFARAIVRSLWAGLAPATTP